MVSTLGIGSGLDLSSLVQQLLTAERAPVENRLNIKEAGYQTELSAYGSLKSAISKIEDSLTSFKDLTAGRKTKINDEGFYTASASETANLGKYQISVDNLAESEVLASTAYATSSTVVGDGSLTFTFGTTVYDSNTDLYTSFTANPDKTPVTVNIDPGSTLADIKDAVNTANFGVSASIVNDGSGARLVFTSEDTGLANSLEISVVDNTDASNTDPNGLSALAFNAAATNLQQTRGAKDANLNVNGLPVTYSSNSITDVIDGVTLELIKPTTSDVKLEVTKNTGGVITALNGFISAFNDYHDLYSQLTLFDQETGQKGALLGDSTLRGLQSTLQGTLVQAVKPGDTLASSLVDLGIQTNADGSLKLDVDTINGLTDQDFDRIVSFVNEAGTSLEKTLAPYFGSGSTIDARSEGLQTSIKEIGEQRISLNKRLATMETRLTKQFTALDTLVSSFQQTSNFLTQQLATIPVPGKKS
ncbi:MAG: flagellar filament capping protein FliD [bacterium]